MIRIFNFVPHAVAILAIAIGALNLILYANDAAAMTAGVTGEMNNDIFINWIGSR